MSSFVDGTAGSSGSCLRPGGAQAALSDPGRQVGSGDDGGGRGRGGCGGVGVVVALLVLVVLEKKTLPL